MQIFTEKQIAKYEKLWAMRQAGQITEKTWTNYVGGIMKITMNHPLYIAMLVRMQNERGNGWPTRQS